MLHIIRIFISLLFFPDLFFLTFSGGRVPQRYGFPACLGIIFHRWRLHVGVVTFCCLYLCFCLWICYLHFKCKTLKGFLYLISTGQMIQALYRASVAAHFVCTWAFSEESTNTSTSCLTTSTCLSSPSPSMPPWWHYTSLLSGHSAASIQKMLNKKIAKEDICLLRIYCSTFMPRCFFFFNDKSSRLSVLLEGSPNTKTLSYSSQKKLILH